MSLLANFCYNPGMSQMERLAWIDQHLREGRQCTVAKAAEKFEVSPRQIKRDIEYLRTRLGAPVVWDQGRKCYLYQGPFELLRYHNERLLLFFVMVRRLAEKPEFLPLVSQEYLALLQNLGGREYLALAKAIDYDVPVSETINLEHFSTICEALRDSRVCSMGYSNARGEASEREIELQRLVNYAGKWYAIAWDRSNEELRTFHLGRIGRLSLTAGSCQWQPEDRQVQLGAYLEAGFGIFSGETLRNVTIRFTGNAARAVARQQWHPQQQDRIRAEPDAEPVLERTLPVYHYTEILGRVLSFGRHAQAMSPPDVRHVWQTEIQAMASLV